MRLEQSLSGRDREGRRREVGNLPEVTLRGSSEAGILPRSCATTVPASHPRITASPKDNHHLYAESQMVQAMLRNSQVSPTWSSLQPRRQLSQCLHFTRGSPEAQRQAETTQAPQQTRQNHAQLRAVPQDAQALA